MTERLIGIDFGTSTTVVHVKNYTDGKPSGGDGTSIQYVEFDGQGMVPTLIQKVEDTCYFGYDAKQPKKDEKICRNFKMKLESRDEQERAEAEELTFLFFQFLHEAYEEQKVHFGTAQSEKTLISYPAKWTERTRRFMISCAERAGFTNVRGMDEPTAAMYSVCVQERERVEGLGVLEKGKSSYVLMIDMGAGTTDLALCRYQAGAQAEILLTWPSTEAPLFFGGHEMDRILMDVLKNYLLDNGFSEDGVARFMSQYEETCRVWKENTVSGALAENKQVDFCFFISSVFQIMGITPGKFPVISRASLEHTAGGYLKIYAMLVNGILEEAKKKIQGFSGSEQIDLVILTGGHSQWYFAEGVLTGEVDAGLPVNIEKIRERPERVIRLSRPQETVARGMVYSGQEIVVVSKEAETAGDKGQTAETGTAAGTKKGRKATETAKDAGLGKTSDSGKAAGNTEKSMGGGNTAGAAGKKKENTEKEESEEAGFEKWIDRASCLDEEDYKCQMELGEYLGDLYTEDDEAFKANMLAEKNFYRSDRQDIISTIMRAYGKPVTTGTEKILLTHAVEGLLDSYKGYSLITTEKILHVDKNSAVCEEYPFRDICYILGAVRDLTHYSGPDNFQYLDSSFRVHFLGTNGSEESRVFFCAYARWRALHGLKPYAISAANYYERVKNTRDGENGILLNHIGLDYMSAGRGKESSPEKAFHYFLKAAEAGSVPALLNLAYCYARGKGTGSAWNYKKAAECVDRFAGQMTGEEKVEEFFYFGYRGWHYENLDPIKGLMPYFVGEMFERGGFGLEPNIEKAILYYGMGRKISECAKAEVRLRAKKTFSFFKKK